jgi:addiction module HigA family antidote
MIPEKGVTTHPGEVLLEEFLKPLEISQSRLAEHLGIPVQRVNELVNGKRGITPETAWLLAKALGTTPEFWMNLQTMYDLTSNRLTRNVDPLVEAS